MDIRVTNVSFSIAKEADSGSCGFCRVILNDCVAINRIRVFKTENDYSILLPKSEHGGNEGKPIVQLLNEDVISTVKQAVLAEYQALIVKYNGLYLREPRFKRVVHVGS